MNHTIHGSDFKIGQTVYTFYWGGGDSDESPHVQKGKIVRYLRDRSARGPYDFFDIELEDASIVMKVWPAEIFTTEKQAKEALIQDIQYHVATWIVGIEDLRKSLKDLKGRIKRCTTQLKELTEK